MGKYDIIILITWLATYDFIIFMHFLYFYLDSGVWDQRIIKTR